MNFKGKTLNVSMLPDGIAKLEFDLQDSSVNKFNRQTLQELGEVVAQLAASDCKGLIFASAKSTFVVGADIMEFTAMFARDEAQLIDWLKEANSLFNAIEDLPMPTVTVMDGNALGGGFELAVATDYRVATGKAVVGFPEVKLGIIPGFGGTVRLPRLIGADNANQWISSGAHIDAEQAFKEGALDALVEAEELDNAAVKLIQQCHAGKLDYQAIRKVKKSPLTLQPIELSVAFETAKAMVAAQAGPHYPAPIAAVKGMQEGASLDRDGALEIEHKVFAALARGEVAANLVQMFINDQFLSGKARKLLRAAHPVNRAAVLGAGIMGGGIAYQSALKGTQIVMKDIAQDGLDLGMAEARKQLEKRVSRGRLARGQVIDVLSRIRPSLSYEGFGDVDLVVEAVVEKADIKKSVLAELEDRVGEETIIATNTSTISVDVLAEALKRPQNFCGMHFFNPVPVMPLVEVIRGKQSSDQTIATTVAYAKALGKTPIVVNNCPGFLVNRILFPYFGAFSQLIHDGADFRQIDRAMENFGWPMGPAYLLDVVGIDTAVHAQGVMAAGFERMQLDFDSAIDKLFARGDLGQKTGKGFYRYEPDRRGKPKKLSNPDIRALIKSVQPAPKEFSDEEIVSRMMLAMCLETVRCLEDGIVETPIEADMGLVLGLGFPPFRGGALRYMDSQGLAAMVEQANKYRELGAMYEPTEKLLAMSKAGASYYGLMKEQAA